MTQGTNLAKMKHFSVPLTITIGDLKHMFNILCFEIN